MNLKTKIQSVLPRFGAAMAVGAFVALSASLTSCVDEIEINGSNGSDDFYAQPLEPSFQFDFELDKMSDGNGSSLGDLDHGEAFEDKIDETLIRVLFFTLDGDYLFESERQYNTVLEKPNAGSSKTFRVTIPYSMLYKGMSEEQREATRQAIEDDGFKVAVLANWPLYVEGERQYDLTTGDPLLGDLTISTRLDFTFGKTKITDLSHCIYDNVYGNRNHDDYGKQETQHIAYQHFVYDDKTLYPMGGRMGVYSIWVQSFYRTNADVRKMIRGGKETQDYYSKEVFSEFDNILTFKYENKGDTTTNDFNPGTYDFHRFMDYDNQYDMVDIWQVWNFSGGEVCPYNANNSNSATNYWKERNNKLLVRYLRNTPLGEGMDIDGLSSKNTALTYNMIKDNDGTKTGGYIQMGRATGEADIPGMINASHNPTSSANETKLKNFMDKAIHFRAYAEGNLKIKAYSDKPYTAGGDDYGKICVLTTRRKSNGDSYYYELVDCVNHDFNEQPADGFDTKTKLQSIATSFETIPAEGYEYIIDPESEEYLDVWVFSHTSSVRFFEMEYIEDRHVYKAGRTCHMPSDEYTIPMYGVQNFGPIGEFMRPNSTFNVSDPSMNYDEDGVPVDPENKYVYKSVFLLRALAKVELLFDAQAFRQHPPEHVMMRSMNRTARCEPKDVFNPTEWVWYGFQSDADNASNFGYDVKKDPYFTDENGNFLAAKYEEMKTRFLGVQNEFDNICAYGPINEALKDANGNTINDTNRDIYRGKTAWFYGIWADDAHEYWGKDAWFSANGNGHRKDFWDWNEQPMNLRDYQSAGLPYPRIFNTRIDRSDYCRMHRIPSKIVNGREYIRYVIYMPEKNIDDVDDKGDLTTSAKVAHVEIRLRGLNTVRNYDDNNCYRIYFTKYSSENGKIFTDVDRNQWDPLEKGTDHKLTKYCEPIVRNCYYKFYINSINKDNQLNVNFEVCGKASRTSFKNIVFN